MKLSRSQFPAGFQFGAAGSSYQTEGHGFGGAGGTHWDSFAATPGNVANGENGSIACDHYHHWPQDLDLAAECGFDAWRFSISWARVIPDGYGAANSAGLDFYDRLIDGICARGMKPFATLYHWELPSPLADRGGWMNRDIADWFADYADTVMRRIGDRIHSVAPINEPWCVAWLSHFMGLHAPGLRDIRATARAMHHVPLAHGAAVQAMRALGQKNIGLVANFERVLPAFADAASCRAADLYDQIYNRWFLSAVRLGEYPADALAGLAAHMPAGWEQDFAQISTDVDWIGINYYTRKLITAGPTGMFGDFREVEGPLPKTDVGWEIHSEGLLHFLKMVWEECARGLPLYVTENGMANADFPVAGAVPDNARISYLQDHLRQLLRAVGSGIDVRGYFVWSFLDNFEWSLGYAKRFGIVHVDFDSMRRTPKASYFALRQALSR
ncbi:MAG: GH1 family beta-glucosidase [Rhodobacteraceae bacterium]|nr:GH1 family beta-glucosidase [Paracoccaceae bacterium]